MPGVTVGEFSIISAGRVVTKNVENNTVVGGNPAKYIMQTNELMEKHKVRMQTAKTYDESYLIQNGITNAMKKQMSDELENYTGYVS